MHDMLLLPANKVWGKVIILNLFCHSVHKGGSASVHAWIPPCQGDPPAKETPTKETPLPRRPPTKENPLPRRTPCQGEPPCQGDTPPRRHPCQGDTPSPSPHPRWKLRGIRFRPTLKGEIEGIRSRPTPKEEIQGDQVQANIQGEIQGDQDQTSPEDYCCRLYASYWNAFLLIKRL